MVYNGVERRLTTILVADVVGYSRLMHEDEEETLTVLREHRRVLIDPTIAKYNGRIVKSLGDGILVEFGSVVDAVRCAITVQEGMNQRNVDVVDDRKMFFRIGVNLGDVIVADDDIYGDGVNIAARLETLSDSGGICISGAVHEQLSGKITQDFEDMGEQALKNIENPVRTYRISVGDNNRTISKRERSSLGVTDLGFGAPTRPSIVILPFNVVSGESDQQHLAEGLRLGILSSLVQLSGLFLVSTDAVNKYRDKDISAEDVGTAVDVDYVLGGAVQQAGRHLRATLQLTDVADNTIVWSERYDCDIDDIFKIQDEVTQEVLISLNIKLVAGETGRIWFDGITDPKAREYYHRGISHIYAGTKDDNIAALRQLHEFYRVQPDTDHAPSFIALIHLVDAIFGWSESYEKSLEQAAEWAEIAIKYERNNGIGYIVIGHLNLLRNKHDEALENCEKAIGIRPSCSFTHGILAGVQNYCGDSANAIKHAREALLLERIYPPWVINILAAAYRDDGKIKLSIPAAVEALRLDPLQMEARVILCSDYGLEESRDEAQRIAQEILVADPTFRLSEYAETKPYRYNDMRERIIEALLNAGLPE